MRIGDDMYFNPAQLAVGFAHAAQAHGVEVLPKTPVTRVLIDDGEVTGVDTTRGRMRAPKRSRLLPRFFYDRRHAKRKAANKRMINQQGSQLGALERHEVRCILVNLSAQPHAAIFHFEDRFTRFLVHRLSPSR